MMHRCTSAAVLILMLAATAACDGAFAVPWFSAALIVAAFSLAGWECFALLRLCVPRWTAVATPNLRHAVFAALLALACVGMPMGFLLALRLEERGLWLLVYVITVAKMTDNGAMLFGRLWGRHKLAPTISPAKTIEGMCGGLLAGIASAALLGPACVGGRLSDHLIVGFGISLLAVLGDLAESFLKRQAGVKDSGSLLPGIGGVLDLVDSLLLAAPFSYFLLTW